MKNRLLFWLSDEFLHFCISKSLQEKNDSDFYAIVEENNSGTRKFFEKQDIVAFKKLWHLREHSSIKSSKPNFDYLKKIEKKYNINLWLTAYSERLFYEEFNIFHKFTKNEILNIVEQQCRLFEQVLEQVKPNFLLINLITRLPGYLLYQMCKASNVKILTLESSKFGHKVFIAKTIDTVDKPEKYVDHQVSTKRNPKELLDYLIQFKPVIGNIYGHKYKVPKLEKYKAALDLFLSRSQKDDFYRTYGSSKRKLIIKKNSISLSLQMKKRESFMDDTLIHKLPTEELFVYFPLHAEPERETLIFAPFFTNQITVVENIAKSLPIDYLLYVKDHPVMKQFGWRAIEYYEKILKLPNVRLLHPSINSIEIIKKASLIISIAGTTGLEAAFYNKPSILLADVDYAVLPFVHRIKSVDDFPSAIRKMIKQKIDFSHLNQYVDYVDNQSITFDRTKYLADFNGTFYYKGFQQEVEIPITTMNSFLDTNKEIFNKLADEHIKKLE